MKYFILDKFREFQMTSKNLKFLLYSIQCEFKLVLIIFSILQVEAHFFQRHQSAPYEFSKLVNCTYFQI